METKRLRNLTTGILHTEMSHIYEDLDYIMQEKGIFTHMLPNINRAILPWLKEKVTSPEYWNEEYCPDAEGDYPLPQMTDGERAAMWKRYDSLPHPFDKKYASDEGES